MSRVGKQPVVIADGATIEVASDVIKVTGPKGSLDVPAFAALSVKNSDGQIVIDRANEDKATRAKHGLLRSLLANAVEGVTKGFEKKLEVNGVGFKINLQGSKLVLQLGFSHPVEFQLPEGVSAAVDNNVITVSGIDKQQVGMVASNIRELKKPEPYKGKGIKYVDEYIIRKAGKTAGA